MKMASPYHESGDIRIYHGDAREVLAELDIQATACVTDPPYGLSDNSPERVLNGLLRVLFDVVLPDLDELDAARLKDRLLSAVPVQSALLGRSEVRSIIESGVGVPEGTINLNGNFLVGDEEIEASDVATRFGRSESFLSHEVDAEGGHFLGNYILDFRDTIKFARRNGFSGFRPELFLGGFSMPVVPVFEPRFPSLLGSLALGLTTFRRDIVSAINDALGISKRAPFVMAGSGAVNSFMLRFDLRGESLELLPTRRARKSNPLLPLLAAPKLVRAGSATGGLPSVFEPIRVRLVHVTADGTSPLYFHLWMHKSWAEKLPDKSPSSGFMNKAWDANVPSAGLWREVKSSLLPGAPLLSFAGSRTAHQMTTNIENAGFDIRDRIAWLQGEGFPKSHDISKAVDDAKGAEREVVGKGRSGHNAGLQDLGESGITGGEYDKTAPATDEPETWDGYGTALAPSHEPITLAMKPKDGTFAENALEHGVAGLNIDAARIATDEDTSRKSGVREDDLKEEVGGLYSDGRGGMETGGHEQGRWPANVVLDEAAAELVDEQSGVRDVPGTYEGHVEGKHGTCYSPDSRKYGDGVVHHGYGDTGGASRFFYTAKASKSDRNAGLPPGEENDHPTVKPTDLIGWLLRLVEMPERNLILDPFAGSGTTPYVCQQMGLPCVAIDQDEESCELAAKRLSEPSLFS